MQGCTATICMPPTTTAIKIEAVKRLGGDIELVGQTYAEAQTHARVRCWADELLVCACSWAVAHISRSFVNHVAPRASKLCGVQLALLWLIDY